MRPDVLNSLRDRHFLDHFFASASKLLDTFTELFFGRTATQIMRFFFVFVLPMTHFLIP